MAVLLNQSTSVTVKLGPFIDDTDGKTAETGLTVAYTDVILSKAGGAGAAKHNTTASAHDTKGLYFTYLDGNDVGTLGELRLDCQISGALPVWDKYLVVPANVYGSLIAGSDYLQTDVENWADAAVAAMAATTWGTASNVGTVANVTNGVTLAAGAITGAVIATDAIDADALSADAVTEIQSGLATTGSLNAVAGEVTAILADTGTDGVVVNTFTTPGKAEVQAEANDALTAFDFSTKTMGTTSNANMTAISGDLDAADNLETMLDGTGGKKLTLEQIVINSNSAGGGIDIDNDTGPGIDVASSADSAVKAIASVANYGLEVAGAQDGVRFEGTAVGAAGIVAVGEATGQGMMAYAGLATNYPGAGVVMGGSGNGSGLVVVGKGTGDGLQAIGGSTSGDGISATGAGTGDGIEATAGASGADIDADIAGTIDTASNAPSAAAIANQLGQRVPDGTSDAGSYDWSIGLVSGRLRDEETTTGTNTASRTLYKPNGTESWGTYLVNTSASLNSYITGTRDS